MKIIALICVIFFATTAHVDALTSEELRAMARDLVQRVAGLQEYMETIKGAFASKTINYARITDRVDFGIPQNPRIVRLGQLIRNAAGRPGLQDCVNMLNTKQAELTTQLRRRLNQHVLAQLDTSETSINFFDRQVAELSRRLQGDALEREITNCLRNEEECSLTLEIPVKTLRLNSIFDKLYETINTVVPVTQAKYITPQKVSDKVMTKIYQPVNQCLNRLQGL